MDISKIVDKILTEWAMRSPDGLVGGHDTLENSKILSEILADYGIGSREMVEAEEAVNARFPFSIKFLVEKKKFYENTAYGIVDAIQQLRPSERAEFKQKFNTLSPEQAVDFVNERLDVYEDFIDALDAARSSKSGDAAGSKAGKGEFIMVLLIAGAESAGIRSGDIVVGGKSIEVKEIEKNKFRATRASFGPGGFNRIEYVDAINEIVAFCASSPARTKKLQNLCDESGLTDNVDTGARGRRRDELSMTKDFFENPGLDSLNVSTVYGLQKLAIHIKTLTKEEELTAGVGDKVEFDMKDHSAVVKLDELPPESAAKLENPKLDKEKVTITVSSIKDEDEQVILPQIKRLKYFKKTFTSKDDLFTPAKVAQQMFKGMKDGHYNGGIIFYEEGLGFHYEPDLENTTMKFEFYNYSQTGPVFTRKGTAD